MSEPIAEGWVTMNEAASAAGYAPAYVARLARRGRIRAHRVGREWLVYLESVLEHKRRMRVLGNQKHNPWRDDLVAQGRGRREGTEEGGETK